MKGQEFLDIEELLAEIKASPDPEAYSPDDYNLLIDRLAVSHEGDELSRLADSAETAFFEGRDRLTLLIWTPEREVRTIEFSKVFEADGIRFEEPTDMMFNFNNPVGACPTCGGFGKILGIDERLVVPNNTLSVYDDCVACWRGEKMSEWKTVFIRDSRQYDFPIHKPYIDLTQEEKNLLWHGPQGDAARNVSHTEISPPSTASSRWWMRINIRYSIVS